MKRRILHIGFLFVLIIVASGIKAQNPLSLYFLENVPQSKLLNPAMTPRANFYIGFPGINTIYTGMNSDILGSDIIQEHNGKYVTLTQAGFDYQLFYKQIGDAANLSSYQTIAPLTFGFRLKKGYFTFGWTEKLTETLSIPSDFFRIMDKGFSDGSNFNFKKLGTLSQYYREFSLGYAFNITKKFKVGAHVKYLQGLAAVKSNIDRFTLKTGLDSWDIDMKSSINLYAPVYVSYDEDGIPSLDSIPSDANTWLDKSVFNFSNPGFAIDLGGVYNLNEGWEFSVSVNDLGFVAWRGEDLNTFNANGKYSFDGIYVDNNNIDSLDNAFDDLLDTIKTAVNFTHGNEHFSTSITPKLYLAAQYRFNYYFSMGLISRTVFAKYDLRQEFNMSANLNLYHFLTTSLSYTVGIDGTNNFGLGLGLRGGPVQFYVALDYLPYKMYKKVTVQDPDNPDSNLLEIPMMPTSFSNVNMMFGINLLFGANGFRDKPMIDTYSEF